MYHQIGSHSLSSKGTHGRRALGQGCNQEIAHGSGLEPESRQLDHNKYITVRLMQELWRDPITRRHPFELLVGDYLSMPNGKGGYHTIGLYLDTYSQHVWAFKYKTAGSAKTTVSTLSRVFQDFVPAETFII